MIETKLKPRLTLGHTTRIVRNFSPMVAFYRDVLGFYISDSGALGDTELAFMSQTAEDHHQFVLVSGEAKADPAVLLVDHIAFRTGSLDDLRAIRANLREAGVDEIMPISHGNAWSLYFRDPEGNGVECFVDTPFHTAQPVAAEEFDLDQSDADIVEWTRNLAQSGADFQPMSEWREAFAKRIEASRS